VAAALSLRPARPDEAPALSELALRSKAHWDYSDELIAACRDELTLDAEQVVAQRTTVATIDDDVVGFFTLVGMPPVGEIGMFFVAPEQIGHGVGAALMTQLLADARAVGFTRLRIEADPNALGFYVHHGAIQVGEVPSASIPGRALPLLELDLSGS
jgi:GNAT superfamily N-acetyltransferase